MRVLNTHKSVGVTIADELLEKISGYGVKAFPKEFGGFLMGYYSDDFKMLTITDSILPKLYTGTPSVFVRSIQGVEKMFEAFYVKKPSQYYVGEWHTHPNGSTQYSQTDLQAMIAIGKEDMIRIKNPVLLILSVGKSSVLDFQLYLYENKKLLKFS